MKKIIYTHNAPEPIGPYSQAVLSGQTLYVSGQIAINPESGELVSDSIENETHQVLKHLGAILRAGGAEYTDVVKCSIFVSDMNDFSAINNIYGSYFDANPPARETVEVRYGRNCACLRASFRSNLRHAAMPNGGLPQAGFALIAGKARVHSFLSFAAKDKESSDGSRRIAI